MSSLPNRDGIQEKVNAALIVVKNVGSLKEGGTNTYCFTAPMDPLGEERPLATDFQNKYPDLVRNDTWAVEATRLPEGRIQTIVKNLTTGETYA